MLFYYYLKTIFTIPVEFFITNSPKCVKMGRKIFFFKLNQFLLKQGLNFS
jgi:hypothetical protein